MDYLNTDALMYIVDRPAEVMVRGAGSWLWDDRGNAYLDFVQGWAVNCLGHSPCPVVEAIQRQAETLMNPSPAFYNAPMIELANRLVQSSVFDKVFFTNCGAEANEGAIKLARKWGGLHRNGAYEIITMEHAFHGRTLATMSASGKPAWDALYEPKVPGFPKVPINDLDAVRAAINDRTVAVMLEPVQGEAGVYPASVEYMQALRKLTREAGVLLIVDEVQTGMGRTGTLFAYEHSGITPDIMTLGKGIGAGVPLAALLATEAVCCFVAGDQGGTYNGNPLVTAAGCAVMETMTAPDFLPHVRAMGDYLTQQLEQIAHSHGGGEVRGTGLLLALEISTLNAKATAAAAMRAGLLLNAPQPHALRFMPALNVSQDEIDQAMAILGKVIVIEE